MKKTILVAVVLLALGALVFSGQIMIPSIKEFENKGCHRVTRYYDQEADAFIYVSSDGGLQVLRRIPR